MDIRRYQNLICKVSKDSGIATASFHHIVKDAIENIRSVRAFQDEDPEVEIYHRFIAETQQYPDQPPVYFRDELENLIQELISSFKAENITEKSEEDLGFHWDDDD